MIKTISGGVTAAAGFTASGVHCGIRHNKTKKDIALIVSECPAAAALQLHGAGTIMKMVDFMPEAEGRRCEWAGTRTS